MKKKVLPTDFVSLGLATRLAEAGHPLGLSCFAPFRLVMKAREKGFLASLAHGRDGLVSLLRRRCGTGRTLEDLDHSIPFVLPRRVDMHVIREGT